MTTGKDRVLAADSSISATAVKTAKPLVHVADLYRPHNDPDDHWDLATAFALAWRGDLDLLGILMDNPKNIEEMPELLKVLEDFVDGHTHVARSPDVAAVGWGIVAGRDTMVSGGRGYAAITLQAVGAAAFGAVLVVCGT